MSGPEIPPGRAYTLVFYSRSADAEPGRGAGERVAEAVPADIQEAMSRLRNKHARRMLSNFSFCCPFEYNKRWYNTVEHAYHATKLLECAKYMANYFNDALANPVEMQELTNRFNSERLESARTEVDRKAVQAKIDSKSNPLQEIDDIEAYASEFELEGPVDTPGAAKAAGSAKGCRDRGIVLVGVIEKAWTPEIAARNMGEIQMARFRDCNAEGLGCGAFANVVKDTKGAALYHYARSRGKQPTYVRFDALENMCYASQF